MPAKLLMCKNSRPHTSKVLLGTLNGQCVARYFYEFLEGDKVFSFWLSPSNLGQSETLAIGEFRGQVVTRGSKEF